MSNHAAVAEITSGLQKFHASVSELVARIRAQIKDIQEKKGLEMQSKYQALWNKFCKTDQSRQAIIRDEMEQLLIACDQALDEAMLDSVFVPGRKVAFDDFIQIMDALENDKDTDEQCILAFSQIASGLSVTEGELKNAKFSDEDIKWLLEHMEKEKAAEVVEPGEEKKQIVKNALKGLKITQKNVLDRYGSFVKQMAMNKKQNQINDGQQRYDFV